MQNKMLATRRILKVNALFLFSAIAAISMSSPAIVLADGDKVPKSQSSISRPLIFVPGIMGSKLCDARSKQVVWGDVFSYSRARIKKLILPENFDVSKLDTEPCGVVFDVTIIPLLWTESYYIYAKSLLEDKLGYQEEKNLFYFDYDWRLGSLKNSERLAKKIQSVKEKSGSSKVDILAHSMGGLVAARYVMSGSNINNVGKIITVATPFWGSASILQRLQNGVPSGPSAQSNAFFDLRSAILSFPSTYELFPNYPTCCISEGSDDRFDIYNSNTLLSLPWLRAALPMSGQAASMWLQANIDAASDTRNVMAAFIERHKETVGVPKLFIAASSRYETASRLRFNNETGIIGKQINFPGDSVVLLSSATGSNHPNPNQFADEKHDVIFKSEALRSWLENILIQNRVFNSVPVIGTVVTDLEGGRKTRLSSVGVSISRNVFIGGERGLITFTLTGEDRIDNSVGKNLRIQMLPKGQTNPIILQSTLHSTGSRSVLKIASDFVSPSEPGSYQISLTIGKGSVEIAHEWLEVLQND